MSAPCGEENFLPVTGQPVKTAATNTLSLSVLHGDGSHVITRTSASSITTLSVGEEPPGKSSDWIRMYWAVF